MPLRAFRPHDLETLYQIDQACFAPGISYPLEELSGYIGQGGSKTWVAEEDGEIAGFLIVERLAQKVAHIITIDVVDGRRRRGVGSLLMDAAEGWAQEQELLLVYLETADNNNAAQAFYQARGYGKVDRVANYYSDGTSAWIMLKWLKEKGAHAR